MNKQEKLWQSGFGTEYHQRNAWEDREAFWYEVLGDEVLTNAFTIMEPGAGKGENLVALRSLRAERLNIQMHPSMLLGVEVNKVASEVMQGHGIEVCNKSFLDMPLVNRYNLVLTRGFLIHVPKAALQATLAKIYLASSRYICLAEYYSPARREVEYHGRGSALWVDDFAGEMMRMYSDLKLINYGFKYHKDNNGNDLTFFLLEK